VRYALLLYAAPYGPETCPADHGGHDDVITFVRALNESGALLGAEQLRTVEAATSVRLRDDERLLTDGPFAETKEHLLGFFLLDVASLDEALTWAARMPHVCHGTVEVRPVVTGAPWQAALAAG